jgi:hypothetical protein
MKNSNIIIIVLITIIAILAGALFFLHPSAPQTKTYVPVYAVGANYMEVKNSSGIRVIAPGSSEFNNYIESVDKRLIGLGTKYFEDKSMFEVNNLADENNYVHIVFDYTIVLDMPAFGETSFKEAYIFEDMDKIYIRNSGDLTRFRIIGNQTVRK